MEDRLEKILSRMDEHDKKLDKIQSREVVHRVPAGEVAKVTGIVGAGVLMFGGLLMLEKKLILG